MILNLDKIKYKDFKIWFLDQIHRKVWFRNFFIYNTVKTAKKSAEKMSEKHGTHFSYYKCLFCDGYHIYWKE